MVEFRSKFEMHSSYLSTLRYEFNAPYEKSLIKKWQIGPRIRFFTPHCRERNFCIFLRILLNTPSALLYQTGRECRSHPAPLTFWKASGKFYPDSLTLQIPGTKSRRAWRPFAIGNRLWVKIYACPGHLRNWMVEIFRFPEYEWFRPLPWVHEPK